MTEPNRKRPRALANSSYEQEANKIFDENWYGDQVLNEGAGGAHVVSDDTSGGGMDDRLTLHILQHHKGYQKGSVLQQAKAIHQQGGRGGERQPSRMHKHNLQIDEAWHNHQMHAGGVIEVIDPSLLQQQAKRMDLLTNRECVPSFLDVNKGGETNPISFSKQQHLVMPIKDPNSDFAENSKKGSLATREYKIAQRQKELIKDQMRTDDSDLSKVVNRVDSPTAVADKLREKYRQATFEERKELDKQARQLEIKNMKDSMSMKPAQIGIVSFEELQQKRKELPIFECREKLLNTFRENDILVVQGETGSGKTTQLVQYLYEVGYASEKGKLIGCTQPRRMATVSVAHRVAQEMGVDLGDVVGYSIRLEDQTNEHTKIKFMTDGVLLQEVLHNPLLEKYSVIVMDEAHERTVNTDVLLGILRDIGRNRSDFKLIVTSATMNIQKFQDFFGNAARFEVSGRTFPVQVQYESSPVQDYVMESVLKALEIHVQTKIAGGDILIFMTGKEDVECTAALIEERLGDLAPAKANSLIVLRCYSILPSAEQLKILGPTPVGKRKCIVATNVAETSLTIDGIRYVIDPGYMKTNVFKPTLGMNTLQIYPVSQAQANQRMGRAGRTAEGTCFRLYTEHQYKEELLKEAVPEIQRSSVDSVVLLLKSIGVTELLKFDFIDAPPEENMRSSLYHLWMLGAVNDQGMITNDGARMAEMPTEPSLAKVLVESVILGCSDEVISIVSLLSVEARSIFTFPMGREDAALAAREKFFSPESDLLTLLNVYMLYTTIGRRSRGWAEEHFLNHNALERGCDIRLQFAERITRVLKLRLKSCEGDTDLVRKCFCAGYFPQSAKKRGIEEYTTMLTNVPCFLHPTSSLHSAGTAAEYVIYHEFLLTTKQYMSQVTVVEPEWLIEYSLGIFHASRADDPAAQQAMIEAQKRKAELAVRSAAAPSNNATDAKKVSSIAAMGYMPNMNRDEMAKQRQQELAKKKRRTFSL